MDPLTGALLPLAVALLLSLGLGRVAARFGVPRVSVYLLVGLALGPHALQKLLGADAAAGWMLGPATEAPLHGAAHLAIGFILFGIGAEFQIPEFRRLGPRALALSGVEIGLTAALVALAVYAGSGDWRLAAVAPALAISSAPSATLVTLREVEAEGPASRCLILCVGHNNLAALLAFPLLASLALGGGHPAVATLAALASLAVGALIGLGAAVWLESITGRRELVLLGILVVLATLGLVRVLLGGSAGHGMLGCFAAGLALANGSPHAGAVFRYLENTVYPLYVLFFIAAGRELEPEALADAGLLGVLFIAARAVGKIAGTRLGLGLVGWSRALPGELGAGLLCQAGVALGLLTALRPLHPEAYARLAPVVIASAAVFELAGPWLVRRTVVRAGEVKLANLVSHVEARGPEALRWVWLELRRNLGLLRADALASADGPGVRHVMRRRPETVAASLPFEGILKTLAESSAELLPVLDAQGRFRGVVSYEEVKNTLYDPALRDLVIARDLTTEVSDPLSPEATLAEALECMDRHRVASWPVVEDGRLAGMVRRADVYALMRRR